MRAAIIIILLAFAGVGLCLAQEAPPSQGKPIETPPAQGTTPPASALPGGASLVDPTKMAAPSPGDAKKPVSLVDDNTYVLGPEDTILVNVYRNVDFTAQHLIRPDGRISINLVGEVDAGGLTPPKLSEAIAEKLKAFLVEPNVTVSVLAVNSKKFLIQGEVNKPGGYPLLNPTNIFQALVNAGGFRDFADKKHITIIRADNTRLKFNYKEVSAGKNLKQNVLLKADDIIVVK
jgi:polysaccharide export outer membrane protein